jgi:transmembrane sensor
LAIAATLLVAVGAVVEVARIRGQVIETERGERREVILADGSVLEVAPGTRLRVKYAEAERRIYLDRGRALFHVAKNPNQPFVVQSEATTVRAVGTAFGVERGAQGVIVTVSEGKVSVSSPVLRPLTPSAIQRAPDPTDLRQQQRVPSSQRPSPTAADRSGSRSEQGEVLLTANEQVTVVGSGTAEPVRQVDSARALAWAQGRLIFQNDEVGRAVAEFNRYNRVQITVSDAELADKPVSGVFNAAEPEAFIAFLQSVTPVEIERHGDRSITIASARRP